MRSTTVLRVGLAFLAASSWLVGIWAAAAPQSFYEDFPGLRTGWVAADGPYNEHLIRDVGGLNIALALVLTFACLSLRPGEVRLALWATLVFGALHAVFHVAHADTYAGTDRVLLPGSVIVQPVVAALLLFVLAGAAGKGHSRGAR